MIKLAENSSKHINLASRYGASRGKKLRAFHNGFIVLQKALEKHKIPQKEVYMDILGTDREKKPTPPKPKNKT